MMRFVALLGLLLTFAVVEAQTNLAGDARLAKAITMRLKVVPLSTCIKQFASETGAQIQVAPNIKDRKVTIIFKNKPAAEAMSMLASALFCDWSSQSGPYVLELSRDSQNEESRLLAAEQEILKERIAAVVQRMVAVTSKPHDQLVKERDKMNDDIRRLQSQRDPDSVKQANDLRRQYGLLYTYIPWWDIGFALKSAPSAADTLAGWNTIWASTKPGEALPLPVTSIPTFTSRVVVMGPDGQPEQQTRTPNGAIATLRCNPVNFRLECKIMGTGVSPAAGWTSKEMGLLDGGEAQARLVNQPLHRRLATWAQTTDQEMLAVKVKTGLEPPVSPGYTANAYTLAEHLEHLADAADISVAADAFRIPFSGESLYSVATVGDYINQLRSPSLAEARGAYFRTEKGWLLCKHARYWRMLSSEIPESVYEPLEAKAKAGKRIAVDDYAAFAYGLTPWQALVYPYRSGLTRFPRVPLVHAMPALRLWGSLSGDQRQQAYSSGLPFAAMDEGQQELFKVASNELLWLTGVNEEFLPILMNGMNSRTNVGLFMLDAHNGANGALGNEDESLGMANTPRSITLADIEEMRARSIVFAFGSNAQSGSTFSFHLARDSK